MKKEAHMMTNILLVEISRWSTISQDGKQEREQALRGYEKFGHMSLKYYKKLKRRCFTVSNWIDVYI